ncbi:enediyne antibiotic chromoprotein [Streptomyces sp. NPDC101776]|uniref:enediyne antibiotic chromoprotein n=1 Tax=Streptomyces sp. NPDC101776 TaxID=3366146 RepID=UPI003816913C
MQLTRSRLSRPVVLGAGVAAVLALATAPASAAPAVSVTPAAGLSDGQSVTVDGSGYTAGSQVAVAECVAGTRCAAAYVVATVDANGAFQVTPTVQKAFQATDYGTGAVSWADCTVVQCQVVAWNDTTGQVGADISFG